MHIPEPTKTAILYLRVSTPRQAHRGGEPEGYSLPAQRRDCIRKAITLGAEIIEEYVERGESAKSADRPELQKLLRRLSDKSLPAPDYVMIHKVDRMARNRYDDALITKAIKDAGAIFVSASEAVDDTPAGKMLHGILAVMAENYSANLSEEAKKGMAEKARRGGTIGLAPMGYLNATKRIDGYEARTVIIDEDRAPHIAWAFNAYATGEWTVSSIRDELEARGLRTRQTAKLASKPLSESQVHRVLSNPYYKGKIRYKEAIYDGRHQPLVDEITWQQVQTILHSRQNAGSHSWKHTHYLKGQLRCERCDSRLGYGYSKGSGGKYTYYFCLGRHTGRNDCDLPYLNVEQVEREVEDLWRTVHFAPDFTSRVRAWVESELENEAATSTTLIREQEKRIAKLERQKDKWLDAYADDAITLADLKKRQTDIATGLADAQRLIQTAQTDRELILSRLDAVLALLHDPHAFYLALGPNQRHSANHAVFETIHINVANDQGSKPYASGTETGIIQTLRAIQTDLDANEAGESAAATQTLNTKNPEHLTGARGSNFQHLVGLTGFEPATP